MGVIRKTKSVKILLDAFGNSRDAKCVVDLVKRFEGDMNKTTVYRILERLEDENILHSFTGKDGKKWVARCQEFNLSEEGDIHPHFQCQHCGKSECLTVNISIPTIPKYKIDSANLILIGQCGDCQS